MNLEGALLREVARVQNDKTLQTVRDLVESLPVSKDSRSSYSQDPVHASEFRRQLLAGLQRLRVTE